MVLKLSTSPQVVGFRASYNRINFYRNFKAEERSLRGRKILSEKISSKMTIDYTILIDRIHIVHLEDFNMMGVCYYI